MHTVLDTNTRKSCTWTNSKIKMGFSFLYLIQIHLYDDQLYCTKILPTTLSNQQKWKWWIVRFEYGKFKILLCLMKLILYMNLVQRFEFQIYMSSACFNFQVITFVQLDFKTESISKFRISFVYKTTGSKNMEYYIEYSNKQIHKLDFLV